MHIDPAIVSLLAQALIALLGLAVIWLTAKAKSLLKVQAEAEQASNLDRQIYQFVEAAEQQLKNGDPGGTARKQYVVGLLEELGVEISAAINARIEAAVYDLNLGQTQ
ncbi:MAG: phage holin family protein [Firmicutes bacterium]|nr:phage holin family protein [Bacillota bacterium]